LQKRGRCGHKRNEFSGVEQRVAERFQPELGKRRHRPVAKHIQGSKMGGRGFLGQSRKGGTEGAGLKSMKRVFSGPGKQKR